METYPFYAGGTFSESSVKLPVKNPYTGKVFAETFLAGKEDLETAINRAEDISEEWMIQPSYKRYDILSQIAGEIKTSRERLAKVLAMESGKPMRYALGEIDRAIQVFAVAAEESKRLPKEYLSLDWMPAGKGKEGLVKYFPRGLVAGISPFNFPLNLAVHKVAPAVACGCPIILKPARSTPLSVLELAKIIDHTSVLKGAISILPMDRDAGNQLVTDPRFSVLSFTGSPEVGWKMKQEAGKKKVILEMGGNAGVIISPSADMEMAMTKCLVGGYAYSGQVCIHVQRVFVHQDVFPAFTEKFVRFAGSLKVGDPMDPQTEISVMIDEENAVRVEEWVKEAVVEGAQILTGGKRKGNLYEPTVLTSTQPSMKVRDLEIFGPVVCLEPYKDFEEAIRLINESKYGLQAGVFTRLREEENTAFNKLQVGGVIINDVPTFRVDHMPYGGVKDSGFGREGIKYAILELMEPRLLVRDL
jgi:acyl-CoA reductase-like NAD-dependent aldehyde dehydrogenase